MFAPGRGTVPDGRDKVFHHTIVRPAEAMIAVNVDGSGVAEDAIVRAFEESGAWQIERTEGRWENGQWADFNPIDAPHLIGGRDPEAGAGRARP